MVKQTSKNPVKIKREAKRIAKLEKEGRIVNGVEIPRDSIPANPGLQRGSGGFSTKYYYKDIRYICAGCGKEDVWTVKQQKKYFEDQKGNIYNEPKWCYECHLKRMQEKNNE